jgi:hypothetical protein
MSYEEMIEAGENDLSAFINTLKEDEIKVLLEMTNFVKKHYRFSYTTTKTLSAFYEDRETMAEDDLDFLIKIDLFINYLDGLLLEYINKHINIYRSGGLDTYNIACGEEFIKIIEQQQNTANTQFARIFIFINIFANFILEKIEGK